MSDLTGMGCHLVSDLTGMGCHLVRWMTRWPLRKLVAGQFTKADAIKLPSYADVAVAA